MSEYVDKWINQNLLGELMQGILNVPQHLLGSHNYEDKQIILSYRPEARQIIVEDNKGENRNTMEPVNDQGVFSLVVPKGTYKQYRLAVEYHPDDVVVYYDPYVFETEISEFDSYLLGQGKHYDIYEKLGAHPEVRDGVEGTRFAVWAPNARAVSVVGDFNLWDGRVFPMILLGSSGIFELFIPGVKAGAMYKYHITCRNGEVLYKTDPYGNYAEVRPGNASKVFDINQYKWNDKAFRRKKRSRAKKDSGRVPMNIYEVHLGSWKKKQDDTQDGFYNYREAAQRLGAYLVEMGYTHVELMGIAEYPFDGSWGYQVGCYYSPTSRYGTPEDFMFFIDHMHGLGIQVILDWVPAHFPKDAHALGRFDGMPLYEHPDPRRGEHPDWGTYIFNYGKNEVSNFLLANALFWLDKYHVDGLRVDAVASMLYLDYGRQDGQWLPNKDGGNEHYEAVEFLKHLNQAVHERFPEDYIIAEESTAWPKVTDSVEEDGLGFTYKWNMGWMNDFTEYMKLDPYFKAYHHDQLCFSLSYYLSENYILVLSHDEVVHGKCSMLNKMPGIMSDKYASLKAAYGFFYGHPGKKLLFMGQEFAQLREWSEARELDWDLLEEKPHAGIQRFIKDMNFLYQNNDALYYNDHDVMGFEWMDCQSWERSTIAFVRRGKSKKHQLMFVLNFTPVEYDDYAVKVPCRGKFTEIINSDNEIYGGKGRLNNMPMSAFHAGKQWKIICKLPPCSVVVLQFDYQS